MSDPTGLRVTGGDVRLLHANLALLGHVIPRAELDSGDAGAGTTRAVMAFQEEHRLRPTGTVDAATAAAIHAAVAAATYTVEGVVLSRDRPGVGGLTVDIVDRNLDADVPVAQTATDRRGHFQVSFPSPAHARKRKQRLDLQARVSAGQGVIGKSRVCYNAAGYERLVVELDANAIPATEFETVSEAIADLWAGNVGDLREDQDRQDLTYIANKSGWDARVIAMVALAAQLAALKTRVGRTDIGLPAQLYYALLRAGLPANPESLFTAAPATVTGIWDQAIARGIIAAPKEGVAHSGEVYRALAATRVLDVRGVVGGASLRDILRISLGDDAAAHRVVAAALVAHGDDLEGFWRSVTAGLDPSRARKLQLDAQLGRLTLNNVPLITRLRAAQKEPLDSAIDLVARGFYQSEAWLDLIGADVPAAIPGDTPERQRRNYAEALAAQVRLSFPTAVVASRVERGELIPDEPAGVRNGVTTFLRDHEGRFEIGLQSIDQYLHANRLRGEVAATVHGEIRRIQRVYQITPDDRSMTVLLRHGIDSAAAVARMDEALFVRLFKGDMGGEAEARSVHAKAQQVHGAVLNVATSYLLAKRGPAVGVHSPPSVVDPVPVNAGDIVAYATLESLFGSVDYCDCEHCRSMLSPAAYLVDLLQHLDRDPAAWTVTMNAWHADHGGAPYPFATMLDWNQFQADWAAAHGAAPVPNTEITPLAVLLSRRPDLEYLSLTCENTNQVLPYIDPVLEVLEYYITHSQTLAAYQGYNSDARAAADELMANPQHVNDAAYDRLRDVTLPESVFPPPLPFHRPLEMLRRFFARFEVPLPRAMELLRAGDALERPNPAGFGWRDILMERLALSRGEYTLLTDRTVTIQRLFGYDPARTDPQVRDDLANVKTLSRRLGVTYTELVSILRTRFINPAGTLIPRLEQLRVPFAEIKTFFDNPVANAPAFDALLPDGLDPEQYGGAPGADPKAAVRAWIQNAINYARIMGLITVANPTNAADPCSVNELELRYANPDNATNKLRSIDFVRLVRFVRLWRKLRWSIAQTDDVIGALFPASELPQGPDEPTDLQHLDAGWLTMLPRIGIASQLLERLKVKPSRDLAGLLACWAPISTYGPDSPYAKMFLGTAPAVADAAFSDDGYGNVLSNAAIMLLDHAEPLRAAFNLTGEDLLRIVTAVGAAENVPLAPTAVPLTLPFVSAVYRWGWLARTLKLSVRELLMVARWTRLDPFAAPDPPNPPGRLDQAPLLTLVQLVQAMRDAKLKPVQALYLIWNQDLSGASAPAEAVVTAFARVLRGGFVAIESAFTIAADPNGDVARTRMALVYGDEATGFFFGLLNDSLVSDVLYSHAQPALPPAVRAAGGTRLGYDDLRKRLSCTGVLGQAARDAIQVAAGAGALATAVGALYVANQQAVGGFFASYPELLPLYDAYVASNADGDAKRSTLLAAFLPELKRRRKRQQALASAATEARTDAAMASAVLERAAVLHSAMDPLRPVLDDLVALERPGLSVRYFWRNTATGNVDQSGDAEPVLDYQLNSPTVLPPNGAVPGATISGIWSGWLELPESGPFGFMIEANAGAAVSLRVDGQDRALGPAVNNVRETQLPVELQAGTLVRIELTVANVANRLAVQWRSTGRGWEIIPPRYLYSAVLGSRLRDGYVRFLKAASLATALRLSPEEMAHLAAQADYRITGQGWVNALDVTGDPTLPNAALLRGVLVMLLDAAVLKSALDPDGARLLAVWQNPAATAPNGDPLILAVTGWVAASLDALLARFGWARADLARITRFRRVFDAYAIVRQAGITGAALLSAAQNEPTATAVRDLQAALRARYDRATWLEVLKGVNDEMRGRQRDALVAYVLRRMAASPASRHIDTPDKLFEYFLLDVQMEPCMQTSRIRQALSSIQLFVERALLNLEPRVPPDQINTLHWQSMKRYRVWEANLKVFLWPENWLEPELRDDQSPFFKEAMGELLQSDITEETAAVALLGYLGKLEEVARLEPCGMYLVENDAGRSSDDVIHAVARTQGAKRKYFYRRQDGGVSWTPWEPIKLDIEDNPVAPVVWRGSLFLFWVKILKQAPMSLGVPPSTTAASNMTVGQISTDAAKVKVGAVVCWSQYYNGKWQPMRTSDMDDPLWLGNYDADATSVNSFKRSMVGLRFSEVDGSLVIVVNSGPGTAACMLHNTHSLPVGGAPFALQQPWRDFDTVADLLTAHCSATGSPPKDRPILKNLLDATGDAAVGPRHVLQNPWTAPFFYYDRRHAYFVTVASEVVHLTQTTWMPAPAKVPLVYEIPGLTWEVPEWWLPRPVPDFDPANGGDPRPEIVNVGLPDSGLTRMFLKNNAFVTIGLGSPGLMQFGHSRIGPQGMTSTGRRI